MSTLSQQHQEVMGLALVVAGVSCSMCANTTVKLLKAVPTLQLMQARFLLQVATSASLCFLLRLRGHHIHPLGPPSRRWLLALRAAFFSGALGCLWAALKTLPVGEATAITYLNPVVCGFLAMQLLGERLDGKFFGQAALSCMGVVLVVDPFGFGSSSGGGSNFALDGGALLAVLGCICFATGNCLVRLLKGVHPLQVQVFQDMLTAFVFMPVVRFFVGSAGPSNDWSAWGTREVVLLFGFTCFGLMASFCIILGYMHAPAGKAALFMYVEVPLAFVTQVSFFGEVPGLTQFLGASLIVGAAAARLMYELLVAARKPRIVVSQCKLGVEDIDSPLFLVPSLTSPGMAVQASPRLSEHMVSPLSQTAIFSPPDSERSTETPSSHSSEHPALQEALLPA